MPHHRKNRGCCNVALAGMMGSGKSTLGRKLARLLGRPFFDSDREVEKKMGMSVEMIFEKRGERDFRRAESRVIASLLKKRSIVLALGGGALENPATRRRLRKNLVIYLKASSVLLSQRVRRSSRPLLKGLTDAERLKKLRALLRIRRKNFEKAHLVISVGAHESPQELAERICKRAKL